MSSIVDITTLDSIRDAIVTAAAVNEVSWERRKLDDGGRAAARESPGGGVTAAGSFGSANVGVCALLDRSTGRPNVRVILAEARHRPNCGLPAWPGEMRDHLPKSKSIFQ